MRFLIILLLFPVMLFGQKLSKEERKAILEARKQGKEVKTECIIKNEVDEFLGHRIIETKEVMIAFRGVMNLGGGTSCSLKVIDDKTYLNFQSVTVNIISIDNDDQLMFKLENDEILKLNFAQHKVADATRVSSSTYWTLKTLIPLDNDTIETLSQYKISKIRYYTSEGYIEDEIKEKHQSNLIELFNCLDSLK